MKPSLVKTAATLVAAITFSGCLTVGQDFVTDTQWIQEGKTRRADVDKKFGPPFRMGYDGGLFTYTYVYYRYSLLGRTMTKDLVVRFTSEGTVRDYSFATSFPEEKKSMDPDNKPKK